MLPDLHIEPGPKTPALSGVTETGNITLRGTSDPEDAEVLYAPLLDWIDAYSLEAAENTEVLAELSYFNTSSAKYLLQAFRRLEKLHKSGKSTVSIIWRYPKKDAAMLEAAEEFRSVLDLPFHIEEASA